MHSAFFAVTVQLLLVFVRNSMIDSDCIGKDLCTYYDLKNEIPQDSILSVVLFLLAINGAVQDLHLSVHSMWAI